MKLVVFAHTPPPLHGQSYMVELLTEGFGGDCRGKLKRQEVEEEEEVADEDVITCFHVNARFSDDLEDVGLFRVQKIFRLLKYCLEAIRCRFRYGADIFYYIPAPPKRIAFYRDCFVLLLCRPFFRHLVFHWQASGLGEWLQRDALFWERWIAGRLLASPDLSITLATSLSTDAIYLQSKRISITPNAIADPCPAFERSVLPYRMERYARRREILDKKTVLDGEREKYEVVFLAHCTREKGLFATLQAITLANQQLDAQKLHLRMNLTVAGAFLDEKERQEFEAWQRAHADEVEYLGFLATDAKITLLQQSDCLCLPTYYSAEAQPVSIIEAMAFGLTIVASAWRGIPQLLPIDYPFLIAGHDPSSIARSLMESMNAGLAKELRLRYREAFTQQRYLESLAEALRLLGFPRHDRLAQNS